MGELAAVSGAVAVTEAEHAPTPVQLLAASVTGGAPAPTLSASAMGLPGDAGQKAAGARRCRSSGYPHLQACDGVVTLPFGPAPWLHTVRRSDAVRLSCTSLCSDGQP